MVHVVFCILLLVIYMQAVVDQLPRLGTRELFFCYCLLVIMWFLLERFRFPLGAWDGLRNFIVALSEPSI